MFCYRINRLEKPYLLNVFNKYFVAIQILNSTRGMPYLFNAGFDCFMWKRIYCFWMVLVVVSVAVAYLQ